MKASDAQRVLAEITSRQWGLVTSAQAGASGVARLTLSRLTDAGHLERVSHGVYRDAGAPRGTFEDLQAAWLSTEPRSMGEKRLADRTGGVVVAGTSAARLHDIGDIWADRHEFVSPTRRQSQRAEIRYRRRALEDQDVTLAHGLPTMTVERTIADLLEDVGDLSLVADVLGDAAAAYGLKNDRLRELLAPLAERNGFRRRDGAALLRLLHEAAGIDPDSVARRVAADPAVGPRVAARVLGDIPARFLDEFLRSAESRRRIVTLQDSVSAALEEFLNPPEGPLIAPNVISGAPVLSARDLVGTAAGGPVAEAITAQLMTGSVVEGLIDAWRGALEASAGGTTDAPAAARSGRGTKADA